MWRVIFEESFKVKVLYGNYIGVIVISQRNYQRIDQVDKNQSDARIMS